MYTSQIITPMPMQNLSYSTIVPQTQQSIPVQPQVTQSFLQVPQLQLTQSLVQAPQSQIIQPLVQAPQPLQTNYVMPQQNISTFPQTIDITQNQIAMSYARYIPPTPTTSTSTAPKIYQFYKYVPIEQVMPQVPQYQILSVPIINNSNYIIQ